MTPAALARHGYSALMGEEAVGAVTSGTYAPYLQKNIGLVYLPAGRTAVGTEFDVDIRGRRVPAVRLCARLASSCPVRGEAAGRPGRRR